MYCRKCGNLIKEGSTFCEKCGESVLLDQKENKQDKKNSSFKFILLIFIILILGFWIVKTNFLGNKGDKESQNLESTEIDETDKTSVDTILNYYLDRISEEKFYSSIVELPVSYIHSTFKPTSGWFKIVNDNIVNFSFVIDNYVVTKKDGKIKYKKGTEADNVYDVTFENDKIVNGVSAKELFVKNYEKALNFMETLRINPEVICENLNISNECTSTTYIDGYYHTTLNYNDFIKKFYYFSKDFYDKLFNNEFSNEFLGPEPIKFVDNELYVAAGAAGRNIGYAGYSNATVESSSNNTISYVVKHYFRTSNDEDFELYEKSFKFKLVYEDNEWKIDYVEAVY